MNNVVKFEQGAAHKCLTPGKTDEIETDRFIIRLYFGT